MEIEISKIFGKDASDVSEVTAPEDSMSLINSPSFNINNDLDTKFTDLAAGSRPHKNVSQSPGAEFRIRLTRDGKIDSFESRDGTIFPGFTFTEQDSREALILNGLAILKVVVNEFDGTIVLPDFVRNRVINEIHKIRSYWKIL